jgi:hypothetical protein
VPPADCSVAIDGEPGHAEDHALDRGGGEEPAPGGFLGGGLGRLLIVDLLPHEVEDPLAEQAGEEPEEETDRLVDQRHSRGTLPAVDPMQSAGRWCILSQRGKHVDNQGANG